jgi:putative membrane protein
VRSGSAHLVLIASARRRWRPTVDRHDVAVATVAQIFAVIAGIAHVAFFVMESLLFERPAVQRIITGRAGASADARLWAFNQGFYNLFLAAGAIVGAVVWIAGEDVVGRTLVIFTCAVMTLAGIVLLIADRRLWRGTLVQSVPPVVGLLAAIAAG